MHRLSTSIACWEDEADLTEDSENDDETSEESSEDSGSDEEVPTVAEVRAEQEIEGDFDRLVQNIRLRDGSASSGTSLLSKDWDFDLAERDQEFKDDLREASGIGRKRKKKGRSSGPVLSQQVKALIGEGNQAYVDNNIPEAIRIMQEVIRIEPRAASAWSVLAQCYEDMKEDQKALQLRIMAAHLSHDAEEWDRLARQSREHGYKQQALYCYRKVYSLDPTNVHALWDRASLAKEMGDLRTARNAFLGILKRVPHDLSVLRELHTILVELSDFPTCASLLQDAMDFYMQTCPSGYTDGISGGCFSNMDLLLLADLYNVMGEHGRAVETIRRGTRWLQGRSDQKYWDLCEDDREYDTEEWPPRVVPDEGNAVPAGHHDLDPNARHRLAVARIKMGDIEEGKLHANCVLSEDVLDYSVLFAEIADAYFERGMFAEAKPIYELLGGNLATTSIYILLQTAACMRNVDELRDAAEVYEQVRLADPTNNDAKMKLAEIYEIMNEPRKALDLVYEVIDSRKKKGKSTASNQPEDPTNASGTSLFAEDKVTSKTKGTSNRAARLTHAQLKELEMQKEKEVVRGYQRMRAIWAAMLADDPDAEREWMMEAEKLVDMFRETRNLFLTSRNNPFRGMFPRSRARKQQVATEADEERMASRLQLDLERDSLARKSAKSGEKVVGVNIFRGISFDDWLRIFMQYCFILTRRGQYDTAEEILRHIMVSNAYQAKERQDSIRLALITCAIAGERHDIVVEQARKLITHHQFNNEPLRILMSSLASGLRSTDAFITSTLQKHLFREMKLSDTAAKNPEILKWNPLNKRYAPTGQNKSAEPEDDDQEDDAPSVDDVSVLNDRSGLPEIPTKENPVIVAIYGQICVAAKSYQSAIFYLLLAYDYCPDDPMICLCLAIASIGRAMQRQSDNRHHLVIQAMAFLSKYRKLRGTHDAGVREVEFNFARTFHQLGLYSHAVKHYERVLEMAERHGDDLFARESAYNLSLIFVFTGATPLADALYRRWLSV
ncbi:Transcription factor tau subunit sfc4 [Psilocybe cubensis]|uniref:Transcription factor tau subunit sfc4 n=2 Tax=Psilocybe cubensis TaxID=181762 RepID=A0ACB8GN82_PSICU|nr:Transcription factor tau subunit sfc4 [Psilocybe cubensis]KAH9476509.1 Transcription factor tau subunit sfc4 [Psilocybe cubensis]